MENVWDTETQEVHGGQTWRQCGNTFVADFSVTTNAFGPPEQATIAAKAAISEIHHYPAADNAAALSALSTFITWPAEHLLVGNGASEFIDLAMRVLPPGPFKPGPFTAAYMEYNRAARAAGRDVLSIDSEKDAAVTVVIHPNSPTGDMLSLDALRALLRRTEGAVVVDESFMPFQGPAWREHSAMALIGEFPERLLVLASWTKLWACPGLRLGSLAASPAWTMRMKKMQTPWSCNVAAQAFFVAACKDKRYMQRSWDVLPGWRRKTENELARLGWVVNGKSPMWVPWVFVDCGGVRLAQRAAEVAQAAGCPVRYCKSFGTPRFIRIGVRRPEHQKVLFAAWLAEFGEVGQNGVKVSNGH